MKDSWDLAFGIAPIECLRLPSNLDGSLVLSYVAAVYPAHDSANDVGAIEKWLGQFAGSKATYHRYRLEAERYLLWATIKRGNRTT